MDGVHSEILIGGGLALLVAGWLLYYVAVWLAGAAVLGAAFFAGGLGLAALIGIRPEGQLIFAGGVGLLGAVGGALGAHLLHKTSVFLIGAAAIGAAFFAGFQQIRGGLAFEAATLDLIAAFGTPAVGVVGGLLCAIYDRLLIALGTSAAGAVLFVQGLEGRLEPWAIIPIALLGLALQLRLSRKRKPRGGDVATLDEVESRERPTAARRA